MSLDAPERLLIASRESRLAMWQAQYVRGRLHGLYPQCRIEVLGFTTRGDRILDRPLAQVGGKGLFIKELEAALESGAADIAVHSMKDVPGSLPPGFAISVVDQREDPRDAFVSNGYSALAELPPGSVVGTSSLRREAQLRARFPRLAVEPLRGNVETRLRRLDEGRYAGIILAAAGLVRLNLGQRIRAHLSVEESIPAVGQGALGIEFLAQRADLAGWLAPLSAADTSACVAAERALSRRLTGSCEVPLGAHATVADGVLCLTAFVASPDGSRLVRDASKGAPGAPEALGEALAERLLGRGAGEILAALARGPAEGQ